MIPSEALPHFENEIYLPMLITILSRDREQLSGVKLNKPYIKLIDNALAKIHDDLHQTRIYMKRHECKVYKGDADDTFTEYIFAHGGYEDHRRYLNVRLKNRTQELMEAYFGVT